MVSARLTLICASVFAAVSCVSASNDHSKLSVKVHEGNVTIRISEHHSGTKKITDDYSAYVGTNGERCYYNTDTDHPGADVGNKPAGDYHQCNDICMSFQGCKTWSWNNHNGGTCWLKSKITGTVDKQGTVSIGCEFKQDGVCKTTYKDIDFVGNDIGNKKAPHHECCGACEKTQGCAAYTWNNDNGGTCYFKSWVGHVVFKTGLLSSSLKQLYGPVCPFEYDTDFIGNDIGNKPAKDAGVCCSACKENKDCKAYSWSNHNGGTCWMKSGKGQTSKATGAISALLVAA